MWRKFSGRFWSKKFRPCETWPFIVQNPAIDVQHILPSGFVEFHPRCYETQSSNWCNIFSTAHFHNLPLLILRRFCRFPSIKLRAYWTRSWPIRIQHRSFLLTFVPVRCTPPFRISLKLSTSQCTDESWKSSLLLSTATRMSCLSCWPRYDAVCFRSNSSFGVLYG